MTVNLYGILIALALGIAAWHATREEKRLGLKKDLGVEIVLYALPPALVVARLYYVAFAWEQFRHNPITALYLWQGGLAIYGAVIGGALGVWWLSRRRGLPFALLADIVAPVLLLGQAIGRWGNYFNGEAYGWLVTDTRLQWFPFAVQIGANWHLATFFYESVWNLLGAFFLYRNRIRWQRGGRYGRVFLWYLVWYGLGRLLIEGLRTDSLMLGSVRVSQLLSLVLVVVGLVLLLRGQKARSAWYALPLAALIAPFLLPGWGGIILAALLLLGTAVYTYVLERNGSVA